MPAKSKAMTNDKIAILWDPEGFDLDELGSKQILALSDGDTPELVYPRLINGF